MAAEKYLTLENLIEQKKQKEQTIIQLWKTIEQEKKELETINLQIQSKCVDHKWIDDGSFDVQNYRGNWFCSVCKKRKN